jgi:hypothetical protein
MLDVVKSHYQSDWYPYFSSFLHSMSNLFLPLMEHIGTDPAEYHFLWFLVTFTDNEDKAIDMVMEELPVTSIMIDYL